MDVQLGVLAARRIAAKLYDHPYQEGVVPIKADVHVYVSSLMLCALDGHPVTVRPVGKEPLGPPLTHAEPAVTPVDNDLVRAHVSLRESVSQCLP